MRSIGDVCFGRSFDANVVMNGCSSDPEWCGDFVAAGGDGLTGWLVFCWRISRIDWTEVPIDLTWLIGVSSEWSFDSNWSFW